MSLSCRQHFGAALSGRHTPNSVAPKEAIFPEVSLRQWISIALFLMMMFSFSPAAWAETKKSPPAEAPLLSAQLEKSLEGALASHRAELADLQARLEKLESLKGVVENEIKTFDSQNTAQNQLLLVSELRAEDLENEIKNNQLASRTLAKRIETVQESFDSASILFQQTTERIELAQKQIAEIRQAQLLAERKQALAATTRDLLLVLQEKKQSGERYLQICETLLKQMKAAQAEKNAIAEKLAVRLENRQKTSLFKRSQPYRKLSGEAFPAELRYFWSRIQAIFSRTTWESQWAQIKLGGFAGWAVFFAVLVLTLLLQGRCRTFLQRVEEGLAGPEWYYHRLGLFLLRHSLPYLSLTVFFGIYSSVRFSLFDIVLGRVLFFIFLVLLVTRWGLDYLEKGFRGPATALRSYVARHLERFFRVLRPAIIICILLEWVSGNDSLLIWLAQIVLSAVILVWTVAFWRKKKDVVLVGVRDGQAAPEPKRVALHQWWFYIAVGSYFIFSLIGYINLTRYWIVAWTLTIALLFWGWISLNALRERKRGHRARVAAVDKEHPQNSTDVLRWSLIQLSGLFWFVVMAAGLVWAWDRSGYLISNLRRFFNETVVIGNLHLNIHGLALAAIILFITNMAVRIGRTLMHEKILEKKSLERGFKDSIVTILSYFGWGFGLLLALAAIGVNATSLAVVFGALSVGIGFGLQNIVNNFISGLILLFERPIQVGDTIEINGLWAEVQKINVRSTVVKTFDNAAVIIPNSEFISKQVTNWSFKDTRMRRSLEVGVAYGSDIDLVQVTMLDIAKNVPDVLNYPKPVVLFTDHADSALIFRLRIWVHVDDYWTVPSKVRSEIDRRFRELGIEIAFPQQDLYIRALPKEMLPARPVENTENSIQGEEDMTPPGEQR